MTTAQVLHCDGAFHLARPDGAVAAIRLAGRPVAAFAPGWRPRGAALGLAPWVLLDLVHEDGSEACWILDQTCEHRASALSELPEPALREIAATVARVAGAAHRNLLCQPHPHPVHELGCLAGINRPMIEALLDLASPDEAAPTAIIDLEAACGPDGLALRLPHGGELRLRAVADCLDGNIQDAFAGAMTGEGLACASPVDATRLISCDSLVVDEHRTAYRFVDAARDLVFYVSATHALFAKSDLYIPVANLAVRRHADDATPLQGLARGFLLHALQHGERLLTYLAEPRDSARPRRIATACRGPEHLHLGHHLWNELTGLDRLRRRLPPRDLPSVIVPEADSGTELFAPIEAIFPEFAGRIDRRLRWPQTLADFVYAEGYCLLRAFDDHVTTELSRRIRQAASRERPTAYDERLAALLLSERTPAILLGVRVENRTAVALEATLVAIIEHLHRRLGAVAIVLDGHNARIGHDPASSFGSFGQHPGHEHPVMAELRVARALQRRFARSPVRIVSLFGAALSRSLFWTQRSTCFVGFWGAGLAKYRWACNRPGLVLSNRWNLQQRGDLGIYHDARYQQDGTALRFIDPMGVTDAPEAPVMFAPINPVPSYSNFHINPDALREALDLMIAENIPPEQRRGTESGQ